MAGSKRMLFVSRVIEPATSLIASSISGSRVSVMCCKYIKFQKKCSPQCRSRNPWILSSCVAMPSKEIGSIFRTKDCDVPWSRRLPRHCIQRRIFHSFCLSLFLFCKGGGRGRNGNPSAYQMTNVVLKTSSLLVSKELREAALLFLYSNLYINYPNCTINSHLDAAMDCTCTVHELFPNGKAK